jgi:hypothetical protein
MKVWCFRRFSLVQITLSWLHIQSIFRIARCLALKYLCACNVMQLGTEIYSHLNWYQSSQWPIELFHCITTALKNLCIKWEVSNVTEQLVKTSLCCIKYTRQYRNCSDGGVWVVSLIQNSIKRASKTWNQKCDRVKCGHKPLRDSQPRMTVLAGASSNLPVLEEWFLFFEDSSCMTPWVIIL